jgi:hypothetical protein
VPAVRHHYISATTCWHALIVQPTPAFAHRSMSVGEAPWVKGVHGTCWSVGLNSTQVTDMGAWKAKEHRLFAPLVACVDEQSVIVTGAGAQCIPFALRGRQHAHIGDDNGVTTASPNGWMRILGIGRLLPQVLACGVKFAR